MKKCIWFADLKGQCHEIFCFWFYSLIRCFPPAPEYSIKNVSIFFENLRRYSQLKVCHGGKWKKIFNQKIFNNFIWSPLGGRGNININFCLQVHFQVSAAWYCSNYLPPVSMIPVATCHPLQQHKGNWRQNLPPVLLIPVANLPPVSLIPVAICHRCHWHWWQICHWCRWHRWCTLAC